MSSFTGKDFADIYKGIINVSDDNTGITSTKKTVQTAEGTDSKLQLSTTAVNIVSGFELGGTAVNTSAAELNYVQGVDANIQDALDAGGTLIGLNTTHRGLTDNPHNVTVAQLSLVIGTNTQAYDAGLTSLATLTCTEDSFIKVTATDTYVIRTIDQTKTDLNLNNVENTKVSEWQGTTNIGILGTIGSGTWSASTIAVNRGGTSQTSYTDGQLLIGNTSGHWLTKATLTGTDNQITISNSAGSITLSTPQDIAPGSSPTFTGLALGAGSLTLTGSIASEGSPSSKGWFANLDITNDPAINGTVMADIYAAVAQTFYIGGTQVAINRSGGVLNLAGIGTLDCGAITTWGTLSLSANNITMTGSISDNTNRVTKLWATDIDCANLVGTLLTANQTNITALGTLTTLTVDNITINGDLITDAGDLTISSSGAGVNINTDTDAGDDFAVNTSMFFVEGDTGNVGIDTNNPQGKLDIRDGTISCIIQNAGVADMQVSSNTYWTGSQWNRINTSYGVQNWWHDGSNDKLHLRMDGSGNNPASLNTIITFQEDGNVGIGFDTSLSKLSIDGGLHVGGASDAGDNNLLVDGKLSAATYGSDGSVTNAELLRINSLSSNVQNQIDGKQASDTALTNLSGLVYASPSFIEFTANDTYTVRTLSEVRTDLGLVIGTDVQAHDNALDSLSGLVYAAPSFIKFTANDTYVVKTLLEVKEDLDLEAGIDFYSKSAEDTWRNSVTETEMGYLNGAVTGTAIASKVLAVDAGKNIDLDGGDIYAALVRSNSNYVMEGYATGRNVDRSIALEITPGTTPNVNINISDASDAAGLGWNYPSISDATNLAKSGSSGSFSLDSSGQIITLELTETVLGIKSAAWRGKHIINSASNDLYELSISVSGGNIKISVLKHNNATPTDWTAIMDASDIVRLRIGFATDA